MKKKSGSPTGLKVLCTLLGIVLVVMVAGTVYASYLMGLMNRVQIGSEVAMSQEEIDRLMAEETLAPDETQAPVMDENEIDWGQEEGKILETDDEIVNIMLIGQDARDPGVRARSDSMILVTFNTQKKTITLTSFLRDLYVKIPGYSDNKMNAAYPMGGMELLSQTLEANFGVKVDGFVEVNFARFAEVIDLLGGVDMELREDEAAFINFGTGRYLLGKGMQHLDGEQALFYSRIRHLDNDADFSRTGRQRKVINALIEKFRNTKLTTLLGLMDDLLPMITTDMTNAEIIGYATELFPMLADCTIVSQRVPGDGAYSMATIKGMSCVVADMDAARKLLEKTFQTGE